jgi:hypothetical protein
VVEEGKWLAGLERLHPQGHLAELDGHLVDIHAVDAPADHVTEGAAHRLGGRFLVACSDPGQAPGNAVGRGDEKVPATTGGIADLERQDGGLGIAGLGGLVEHRVEG